MDFECEGLGIQAFTLPLQSRVCCEGLRFQAFTPTLLVFCAEKVDKNLQGRREWLDFQTFTQFPADNQQETDGL